MKFSSESAPDSVDEIDMQENVDALVDLNSALAHENEEMKEDLRLMKDAFNAAAELIKMFTDVIPLTIEERKRVDTFTERWRARWPDHEKSEMPGSTLPDPDRTGRNAPEPMPADNGRRAVWDLFFTEANIRTPEAMARDIIERDRAGAKKYGTRLQTDNGRDARVDAYQELLDGIAYTTQWAFEQDTVALRQCVLVHFTEPLVRLAEMLITDIEHKSFGES